MKKEVLDDTLESFFDGSQDFLSFPIFMAKFTKIDHLQNVETLCQQLDILSDSLYLDSQRTHVGLFGAAFIELLTWISSSSSDDDYYREAM